MARNGVGIDIGARSVRVVQLERRGEGYAVTAALRLSRPADAGEGALEPETATDLGNGIHQAGIPAGAAVVGLSGRDLILRYTQVPPVPDWRLTMLMDFEISELAGKSGGEVASDWRLLDVPPDAGGNRTVLVGLAKVEALDSRLDALAAAKLPIRDTCPASLGLCHAILAAGQAKPDETLLVLDIGARNTEMIMLRGGALLFARNLSNGGDQFTKAVADALALPATEAEGVKHREGNVSQMKAMRAANARAESVLSALAGAAGQYAAVLQSSLMFARAQTRIADLAPTRVLITGGGSRLKGLADFLSKALKVPVETFDPLQGLTVDLGNPEATEALAEAGPELSVAVGLARVAMGEPGVRLRLLPPRVLRRREFVERKVFLFAGAAAAVVFLGLAVVSAQGALNEVGGRASAADMRHREAKKLAAQIERVKLEQRVLDEMTRALRREALPGPAFVRVLGGLQSAAPAELFLEEAKLIPKKAEELGSGALVEISGKVAEVGGGANPQTVLDGFMAALRGHPDVASVVQKKSSERSGVRSFTLELEFRGEAAGAAATPAEDAKGGGR